MSALRRSSKLHPVRGTTRAYALRYIGSAPCATGGLNPHGPVNLAGGWKITLGIDTVVYAGSAPELLCGIVQINLLVPPAGPLMDRLLPQFGNPSLGVPGGAANTGATVSVK